MDNGTTSLLNICTLLGVPLRLISGSGPKHLFEAPVTLAFVSELDYL